MQSALALGLTGVGLRAQACEFFTSNLRIMHPWTRASGDDDTSAIVSMLFDQVQQDDRLIGVETMIATGAEIVESGENRVQPGMDFFIPKGQETVLSETGTFLRLTGLRMPLDVGRTYPMRLVFKIGGAVPAELSIDFLRFR